MSASESAARRVARQQNGAIFVASFLCQKNPSVSEEAQ